MARNAYASASSQTDFLPPGAATGVSRRAILGLYVQASGRLLLRDVTVALRWSGEVPSSARFVGLTLTLERFGREAGFTPSVPVPLDPASPYPGRARAVDTAAIIEVWSGARPRLFATELTVGQTFRWSALPRFAIVVPNAFGQDVAARGVGFVEGATATATFIHDET